MTVGAKGLVNCVADVEVITRFEEGRLFVCHELGKRSFDALAVCANEKHIRVILERCSSSGGDRLCDRQPSRAWKRVDSRARDGTADRYLASRAGRSLTRPRGDLRSCIDP